MSWCRWGSPCTASVPQYVENEDCGTAPCPGSDVYVFEAVAHPDDPEDWTTAYECCGCSLQDGDSFRCGTDEAMVAHLKEHVEAGHHVRPSLLLDNPTVKAHQTPPYAVRILRRNMKTVAVIPARENSERFPGKNRNPILRGRSGVELAIEHARAAGLQTIIVTTDDPEIFDQAVRAGVMVVGRPEELATADATTEAAVLHALGWFHGDLTVVLLQATSPLREPSDVLACLDVYEGEAVHTVSEDAPERPNGAVYICSREHLAQGGRFACPGATLVTMPASRSIDVDTQADWDAVTSRPTATT